MNDVARKIQVLIVDDSSVVRRLVAEELSAHADIEVVGTAIHGQMALEKVAQLAPDLVILDIEMPEMDGLTALRLLHERHRDTPVIMFSSLTELGAAATLEALSRGASDFFTKPTGVGGMEASRQVIRNELVPAIRTLCAERRRRAQALEAAAQRSREPRISAASQRFMPSAKPASTAAAGRVEILAIGASTGGPNALADLFTSLPGDFPVPIVIVQHMPPMFTRLLAERLTKLSKIPTAEAESGVELTPGRAWIAPGDYHLELVRDERTVRLQLHQGPSENACRPAVDPLFRSVAAAYGRSALAVVLTGMGQDGLRGCEAIRAAAGQIIVQDESSSVVWGMPGAVARAGLADRTLPLPLMASDIVRRVRVACG